MDRPIRSRYGKQDRLYEADVNFYMDEQSKEIERLKGQLTDEIKIVSRVWNALGVSTYADAHGKEISQIVAEKVARVKELEAQIEAAKVDGEVYKEAFKDVMHQEYNSNEGAMEGFLESARIFIADSKNSKGEIQK